MSYDLISDSIIPAITGGVFSHVRVLTVSETLLTSPAFVLASYIIQEAIGSMTNPEDNDDWPLYVSYTPDGAGIKTDLGVMFDTTPIKDGRSMEGPIFQHYGIQLKIRSSDYETGYAKIENIASTLDSVSNESITISDVEFQIQNISRSGIISLGAEPTTKKRYLFTVNFVVSMKRVS